MHTKSVLWPIEGQLDGGGVDPYNVTHSSTGEQWLQQWHFSAITSLIVILRGVTIKGRYMKAVMISFRRE